MKLLPPISAVARLLSPITGHIKRTPAVQIDYANQAGPGTTLGPLVSPMQRCPTMVTNDLTHIVNSLRDELDSVGDELIWKTKVLMFPPHQVEVRVEALILRNITPLSSLPWSTTIYSHLDMRELRTLSEIDYCTRLCTERARFRETLLLLAETGDMNTLNNEGHV